MKQSPITITKCSYSGLITIKFYIVLSNFEEEYFSVSVRNSMLGSRKWMEKLIYVENAAKANATSIEHWTLNTRDICNIASLPFSSHKMYGYGRIWLVNFTNNFETNYTANQTNAIFSYRTFSQNSNMKLMFRGLFYVMLCLKICNTTSTGTSTSGAKNCWLSNSSWTLNIEHWTAHGLDFLQNWVFTQTYSKHIFYIQYCQFAVLVFCRFNFGQ